MKKVVIEYSNAKLQEYNKLKERAANLLAKAKERFVGIPGYEKTSRVFLISFFSALLGLLVFAYTYVFNPISFESMGQYLLDCLKLPLQHPIILCSLLVLPISYQVARCAAYGVAKLEAKHLMKKANQCYQEYKQQNKQLIETFVQGVEKILTCCRLYDWTKIAHNSADEAAKQLARKMIGLGVNKHNFEEIDKGLLKEALTNAIKGLPVRLQEELRGYLYDHLKLPMKKTR